MHQMLIAVVACALFAGLRPAAAVIPADVQVQKKYRDAEVIFVGSVSDLPKRGYVEVHAAKYLKGNGPAKWLFRARTKSELELIAALKAGLPAAGFLLLDADKNPVAGLLHAGDMWLKLSPGGMPPTVDGKDEAMAAGFPGRTATLVRLLTDLAAGKPGIRNDELDYKDARFKNPRLLDLGELRVKPTFVAAVDFDADGKADLIVGTAAGLRLFVRKGAGFADATDRSGLAGKTGTAAALAELAGPEKPRPGLVTPGETFVLNAGRYDGLGPNVGTAAGDDVFAFGSATDTYVAALRTGTIAFGANGRVGPRVRLRGPVAFPKPAGAILGGGFVAEPEPPGGIDPLLAATGKFLSYITAAPAGAAGLVDEIRFTGIPPIDAKRTVVAAGIIDLNGDRLADVYVAFDDGGDWVVLNRGYGCFFPHLNPLARRAEWKLAGVPAPPPALVTSADVDADGAADVVFVSADGRVYAWLDPLGRGRK
jgi:hypothetical protein